MKKANDMKMIMEQHTNRMLVATVISFVLLIVLLFVHKFQMRGLYIETRMATLVLSIVFAVLGIGILVYTILKKKNFLYEYVVVAFVMAFCFYGIHGVKFVNAKHMKYGTSILVAAYFIGSYIYHTYFPKFLARK
jgi:hypothetical protein